MVSVHAPLSTQPRLLGLLMLGCLCGSVMDSIRLQGSNSKPVFALKSILLGRQNGKGCEVLVALNSLSRTFPPVQALS